MGDEPSEYEKKYQAACEGQGFAKPYRDTPFDENPAGWHHGEVDQTGGFIMVRIWRTEPGMHKVHDECPGDEIEYEVAFGEQAGASLQSYKWNESDGAYVFHGVVEDVSVGDNTPEAKREAAKQLMEQHGGD